MAVQLTNDGEISQQEANAKSAALKFGCFPGFDSTWADVERTLYRLYTFTQSAGD